MLPGDFTTHPCPEYFSLDLATTFILQEAQYSLILNAVRSRFMPLKKHKVKGAIK